MFSYEFSALLQGCPPGSVDDLSPPMRWPLFTYFIYPPSKNPNYSRKLQKIYSPPSRRFWVLNRRSTIPSSMYRIRFVLYDSMWMVWCLVCSSVGCDNRLYSSHTLQISVLGWLILSQFQVTNLLTFFNCSPKVGQALLILYPITDHSGINTKFRSTFAPSRIPNCISCRNCRLNVQIKPLFAIDIWFKILVFLSS